MHSAQFCIFYKRIKIRSLVRIYLDVPFVETRIVHTVYHSLDSFTCSRRLKFGISNEERRVSRLLIFTFDCVFPTTLGYICNERSFVILNVIHQVTLRAKYKYKVDISIGVQGRDFSRLYPALLIHETKKKKKEFSITILNSVLYSSPFFLFRESFPHCHYVCGNLQTRRPGKMIGLSVSRSIGLFEHSVIEGRNEIFFRVT